MPHGLQVVLVAPEIPLNVGSIGRLCLGAGATLHLVDPLGFVLDDKHLRRAGLDYWRHLRVVRHASAEALWASIPPEANLALFTKHATQTHFERDYAPGTYLVFGSESRGLPDWMLRARPEAAVRIPIYDPRCRSLNLANAVAVAVYEAIRRLGP